MRDDFPNQDDLLAYLQEQLPAAEAAALEARLAQSPALREELERTRTVLALVQEASEEANIRRANELLERTIRAGASDLHLDLTRDGAVARLRVDGVLHESESFSGEVGRGALHRLKQLLGIDLVEQQRPADGRCDLVLDNKRYDLRGSFLPTLYGGRLVIRVFDASTVQLGLDRLGFFADELEAVRRLTRLPSGLLVAAGPTGAGKTTVLYSLLHELARPEVNVLSIEDPVELALPWVAQVRLQPAIGNTYPSLLRAILRQDPDVIMVGEVRDTETLQMSIQAALTGHLVLATLHARDAVGVIRRLVEMGAEPYLLAEVLVGVIGCRLARLNCPHCASEVAAQGSAPAVLGLDPRGLTHQAGAGCERCRQTGYRGRSGIFEVVEVSAALADAIANGASDQVLREQAFAGELPDFRGHAVRLVAEGRTTPGEAARVLSLEW